MKHIAFAIVVGAAAACAARVPSGTNPAHTEVGTVRYEMRQRTDGAPGEVVAIAQLSSTMRNSVLVREVEWLSVVGADGNSRSLSVPRYDVTANPRTVIQSLAQPVDADIVGVITDFYTFLFAVSPRAGISALLQPGDAYSRPDPIVGDWADGRVFLLGQDRLRLTNELLGMDGEKVTFRSSFAPPPQSEWALRKPWMESPVCEGVPNNFQMVRKQQAGFLAVWGCERFSIESQVDRLTHELRVAELDNQMSWRLRACTDEQLDQCVDLPNVRRRRVVTVEEVLR